jgi:TatD DNase family protein
VIDSHTHLDRAPGTDAELVAAAREQGVRRILTVGTDTRSCHAAIAAAEAHEEVFAAVGRHPNDSTGYDDAVTEELRALAQHPNCRAIGETGLDYYRDYAPRADQERWFRAQLQLADELGLPVVIHQRSALEDTLAILEEVRPSAGGVLHCFDDGLDAVARANTLGFKLGLGGVLTYGHAVLDEAVRQAPADMLMLETDAPYLEPEPRSLRRNEPGLLTRVLPRLCELRGWTPDEVNRVTTANARALFRLPIDGAPPSPQAPQD